MALALAISLTVGGSLTSCGETTGPATASTQGPGLEQQADLSPYALALASYPEMAGYPNEREYIDEKTGEFDHEGFQVVYDAWQEDRQRQRNQPEGYADSLTPFFDSSVRELLSDSQGENRVCSPVNLYMGLAMLAELSGGESRQQILSLLDAESTEALRAQAEAVWNAHYCDDGSVTSILANSLWMSDGFEYNRSTLEALAEYYKASAFSGEMGNEDYNEVFRSWINQQTDGLLEQSAAGLELEPSTVLAQASTIAYRAKWTEEFSKDKTEPGSFSLPGADGGMVDCDFMRMDKDQDYFWADSFAAVSLNLRGDGRMWFLLPDEGISPESLLAEGQAMDFIRSADSWADQKRLIVHLAVPKFDVASDLDLRSGLEKLGITDVFDPEVSDFEPLSGQASGIFVSQATHAARVAVDEEGVSAAAYVVMMEAGAGMPPEDEVDFVLDRPFLFVIESHDGLPLFVGVVNRPVG